MVHFDELGLPQQSGPREVHAYIQAAIRGLRLGLAPGFSMRAHAIWGERLKGALDGFMATGAITEAERDEYVAVMEPLLAPSRQEFDKWWSGQ